MVLTACLAAMAILGAATAEDAPETMPLRLNHIQVIGTHNSYHVQPMTQFQEAIRRIYPDAKTWEYTHPPLDVQLDRGVYSFELDLHVFTESIEVFHVPIYDEETTCRRFTDCLQTVRDWSDRHPGHLPVSFLMEIKVEETRLSTRPVMPIEENTLLRIEEDILSVFPRENIIMPDTVRGDAPTLREAVENQGWPLLKTACGKVLFILHDRGRWRDLYTHGRPSLEGRIMFVNSSVDRSDAAILVMDNPQDLSIPEMVRRGFIIRTRADSGLREARRGDTSRRDAAFASGAHIISTDYPPGSAHPETGYEVLLPNGAPAQCNPVNAPPGCEAALDTILSAQTATLSLFHRPDTQAFAK